jgi:hypothetical protein
MPTFLQLPPMKKYLEGFKGTRASGTICKHRCSQIHRESIIMWSSVGMDSPHFIHFMRFHSHNLYNEEHTLACHLTVNLFTWNDLKKLWMKKQINAILLGLFTLCSGVIYILYKMLLVFNTIVIYTLLSVDGKRRRSINNDNVNKNTVGSLWYWKCSSSLTLFTLVYHTS